MKREDAGEKIEQMERKPERDLLIRFNADKSASMQWDFRPQQSSIRVGLGFTVEQKAISDLFFPCAKMSLYCKTIHMKMCFAYRFIFMHNKLTFV